MPGLLRKWWSRVLGGATVVAAILVVAKATGVIGGVPGGMRHYESQDLGFSFDYPSDWTVSAKEEGVVNLMSPEEDAILIAGVRPSQAGTPGEAADAIWQEYQATQPGDLAFGPQQKISVNGRPAVLQSVQHTSRGEAVTIHSAVILDGGQEYFVWLLSQDGSVENPQGMMDKVLAGFDTQ